ncbi:ABC transporter ATP-binding protein [Kocuria sp.]|uniref:ABC transporter ATP-binding protein n=1 Tax=Kocuria sp. TaxID=1871328 RepID=UPI0026DFE6FD|nr:ABC transporter ATP-binding protein [Kocuria sp.]MDO5619508.1 ABC transporter ATP-binding protein [Kocuria sp.]
MSPAAATSAPWATTTTPHLALRMDDLRVATVGGTEILHGVNLQLRRGEILGLVGESGSGKTTAGLACLGHFRAGLRYTSGKITVLTDRAQELAASATPRADEDSKQRHAAADAMSEIEITALGQEQLRALRGTRVAYIPQDPALSLNPAMRVGEQIREVLDIHGFGASSADRAHRVSQVLEDVGLPSTAAYQRRWPHELSGGQQQRIGIAMAFAMTPEVLILDEPTTGLDVSTQSHVLETIRAMTSQHDVASLYITHDLAVVAELADRVAVMLRGDVVEEGSVQAVLTQPQHPYTRKLLDAVPDLAGRKQLAHTGQMPVVDGVDPQLDTARGAQLSGTVAGESPSSSVGGGAPSPLLRVTDLKKSYGQNTILQGVNFTLEPGQSTMVLGESGSGKTTLSRCVAGLIEDYQGSVALRGHELAASTRKRTNDQRQAVQYVFQSPYSSLNPRRSIGQSLTVPLEMSGKLPARERRGAVEEALDAVRLGRSFYDRRPGDLSGGERQRAAVARALVNAPDVLVCDEITSALDVSVQASIVALLNQLREERGLALLFVTHNITLARHIADHILVLNQGVIVDSGPVDQVLEAPTHEYTQRLLADVPTL